MMSKLPRFTRNFYVIFLFFFLIWMLFFDSNNFISQIRLASKKGQLEEEKEYYIHKIEEVKKERKELLSNPILLEKFAREKYLMKKPSEDVFVVIDKKYKE
jgi:cell division protein DivIC